MLNALRSWRDRRQAMQELRAMETEDARAVAGLAIDALNLAQIALDLNDNANALMRWREARLRYPQYVLRAPGTLGILLRLKLFDEAETIMLEGQKRFPRQAKYAEGYAVVAHHREDREAELVRWQQVRKRFPGSWTAYANAAGTLRELGRVNEADTLLRKGIAAVPNEMSVWLEYARLAEHMNERALAQQRWKLVSQRFGHVLGTLGQARMMVALGNLEEADQFLDAARSAFQYDSDVLVAWARLPELWNDMESALERWTLVRQRFPTLVLGYQERARLLKATGKLEEFESFLQFAVERFPSQAWPDS